MRKPLSPGRRKQLIDRMVELAAERDKPVTRKATAWLADYEALWFEAALWRAAAHALLATPPQEKAQ